MDLSIIIVSWKVKDKLKANLQALYASKGNFSFEVFVVDNNSGDGTVEMVKNDFPQVKLIANTDNLGFAKANNQALSEAKGDYLLLLNPDMLVNSDTLINSLTWARRNQQAVVSSCQLVTLQGEIIKHVRNFPTLFDQLMIILKVPHLIPAVLNNYLQPKFNYNQEAKVDSVRGAFFLINRHVWQELSTKDHPVLDEQYFIWFEEVDFCRQVYALGGEVWYFPDATCVDYVGASFGQVNINVKQGYFEDSMLKYFKKWHAAWQYYLLKITWPVGRFLAEKFSK
ncbi:MAG: glycosyltransferase family 2 protein [Patescibacteria group bacterium]